MKKKMIAVVLIVLLLGGAIAGLIFGVRAKVAYNEGRVLNATVRYFDGEREMIELDSFSVCSDALVRLVTKAGDVMYIGPNNVIIFDEEAGT